MKYISQLKIILFFAILLMIGSGCNKKTGCPANEAASVKVRRNGELSGRKGNSKLFNRKMTKKMKKR